MLRRLLGMVALLAALGVGVLACGEDDGAVETRIVGETLTVYSSLPLQGPLAPVAQDVLRAQKLALQEAGGSAGAFAINLVSLSSSDPETGRWDPGRVAANARKAVQDRSTIAYLGEFESGASAVSLPILNEGGILQVSPRDTFGGLTERGGRGEPDKYYPSGVRTFTRVVPSGEAQARELVDVMQDQGVRRLVLADDRRLSGASTNDRIEAFADAAGIEVVDRLRLDDGGEVPGDLGREVGEARPDGFVYGGAYGDFAVGVLQAVHAAAPDVRLYGTDELTVAPDLAERAGEAADRLELTGVDPQGSGDEGFARRFRETYGAEPDPQAILGHRAMAAVLDAVERLGKDAASRRAVIDAVRRSARAPRARFARYRVMDDRLVKVGPAL